MTVIMDELRMKLRNVPDLSISVVTGQGGGRGDRRPIQVGLRVSDMDILENMRKIWRNASPAAGRYRHDISTAEAEPE
jgi:HAE1 family hydrophobic/amphiphilic exporter-1